MEAQKQAPYAAVIGRYTDEDPRLVESFMRLQYGTLDHLSRDTIREEIRMFEATVAETTYEPWIDNAESYGFDVSDLRQALEA